MPMSISKHRATLDDLCVAATRALLIGEEIEQAVTPVHPTDEQLDNWLSVLAAHHTFFDPGPKEIAKHMPVIREFSADAVWGAIRNMLLLPPWMINSLADVERECRAARDGYTLIR